MLDDYDSLCIGENIFKIIFNIFFIHLKHKKT